MEVERIRDLFGETKRSRGTNSVEPKSPWPRIIVVVLIILGLVATSLAVYYGVEEKRKRDEDAKESRRQAIMNMKKIRSDDTQRRKAAISAKAEADARTRSRMAQIVFGFDNPMVVQNDAAENVSSHLSASNITLLNGGVEMFNASSESSPGGNSVPISIYQTVALALCPRETYELWSNPTSTLWSCLQKCPPGYETITYAPTDAAGNPLMVHPIDPITNKEDLTKTERVPPTPWCRAICPILLGQINDHLPKYSEHMRGDIKPVIYNNRTMRTDDTDPAYCSRQAYRREILKGGDNIVCGWCEKDIPDGGANIYTSTNRHHCETDSKHFGIDFTDWCQRRRLIPNLHVEKIDDTNDITDNVTDTPICSAIGGSQSGVKKMVWMEGPKACRGGGELLPINSSGYFDGNGNATGLVSPQNLFFGSTIYKIPKDKVVARFASSKATKDDQKDYSLMHYACYTSCPLNMIPVGPIENHLCAESCPPNTSSLLTFSDDIRCKKMAFQQPPVIDDFMLVVQSVGDAIYAKMAIDAASHAEK